MNWLKTPAQERKAKAARIAKTARRHIRKLKGIWPVQDEAYKAWIRTLPCVVCFLKHCSWDMWIANIGFQRSGYGERGPEWNDETQSVTQCAHVGPVRGIGQKCSDHETAPLCGEHHDHGEPESHHTLGRGFWTYHGIAYNDLIAGLNAAWEAITGPKSATGEDYA